MTTTPSLTEFMALPSDPDEDLEHDPSIRLGPVDPLVSIAESMQTLALAANVSVYLDRQATALAEQLEEAKRDLADAEATVAVQGDLIERVLEVVKPSTSKLANSVREVLSPGETTTAPEPPAGEHDNDRDAPPAADAAVEEWRAFARSRGYAGPDIDKANRSQIRTMLGIEQPVAES